MIKMNRTANITFYAFLIFLMLPALGCGGKDPGIPIVDGDDDDDAYEFDFEVIPEYDVEWETLPESRCSGISHNNDVTVKAAEGGTVAYCLPGDALDGSSLLLDAGALSADARIIITGAQDFEFAEGVTGAGPAIRIGASALNGSEPVLLKKASSLTLPLYKGLLASDSSLSLQLYYNIDGKTGVLTFGQSAVDGDMDSEADEEMLWEENVRYLIDANNELFSLPVRSFGIYQVAMPESGARRK